MSIAAILTFIGGIGLFLLGMRQMTDGLKLAAGDTLRSILSAATQSRWRGLASGVLITAMVQSSSAVVFATVGFVNAGLLTLYQSVGVIYGSNLGTTLTSWIVALVGFNVDLRAMAMPAIGLGMAFWVAFGSRRMGALGQALAGFGLFFLGIDLLRDTFAGMGDAAALEAWAGRGVLSLLLFTLVGIVLTVLMQSSSAALAVTLTAAAGGLIPLSAAAAMVIGANVGTTSTAAFAAIGATAAARRAASAHVLFNVITAVVAFTTLPLLLWLATAVGAALGFAGQLALLLAVFHTMTKLLGVAVMWPITSWMVAHLERRFRSTEEDESQPRYLDRTVQATPVLALGALTQELHRMNAMAAHLAGAAVSAEPDGARSIGPGRRSLENLSLAVGEFAGNIQHQEHDALLSSVLPDALRVSEYLVNVAEHAEEMAGIQHNLESLSGELAEAQNLLRAGAADLLGRCAVDAEGWNAQTLTDLRQAFESDYQALKRELLRAGSARILTPRQMAAALEYNSELHRVIDQATKAALYLDRILLESKPFHPAPEVQADEGGALD